jgi:hypothetical protein
MRLHPPFIWTQRVILRGVSGSWMCFTHT